MSENHDFSQLATALVKAQGTFPAVHKTGKNPHLDNAYATLDDIIGAVRKPLADNGLSFVQLLNNGMDGELLLKTTLIHESGQAVSSTVIVPPLSKSQGPINNLQALGVSITYMKRYALSAMLGIAVGDDTDGEGAEGEGQKKQAPQRRRAPQKKQAPKQEAAEGSDGSGISTPKELFAAVNAEIPYYNSVSHCYQTLRKEDVFDKTFEWNRDIDSYDELFKLLVEYARLNTVGAKE